MASHANGNISLIIANYLYVSGLGLRLEQTVTVKTKVLIHKPNKQQGKMLCCTES